MSENKIYILVPVYNTEQYIHQCADSVLKQNYSNYELVLVDDGSPDHAGVICDELAVQHEHFTVIHQKNQGLMGARKTAVNYVLQQDDQECSYVIFLDSDDALEPHALNTINRCIQETNCDLLIYGYRMIENGKVKYTSQVDISSRKTIRDRRELFREAVITHTLNSLCRKAIKGTLIRHIDYDRLLSVSIGEDLIQSLPLYYYSTHTEIIPDPLYRYRTNPESMTQSINVSRFLDDLSSREYLLHFVKEKELWNQQDFEDYRIKCLSILKSWIKQIGNLPESIGNRASKLSCIWNHSVYKQFLMKGPQGNLLLSLFKYRAIAFLILLFEVKHFLKRMLPHG